MEPSRLKDGRWRRTFCREELLAFVVSYQSTKGKKFWLKSEALLPPLPLSIEEL